MSKTAIRTALETHLAEWLAANPEVVCLWDTMQTRAPATLHIRPFLIPADNGGGTFCATGFKGLYQINVFGPAVSGPASTEGLAGSLAGHFAAGTNTQGVRVPVEPTVGELRPDSDGLVMVPVKIRYFK